MKRRQFINQTSMIGAGGLIGLGNLVNAASIRKHISANDKIRFGVIGCNGMGWSNVRSLLEMEEVELIAIADVDQNVIDRRADEYKGMRKNKFKTYKDYRKVLDDKDVDFVVVGTPDHWHCKIMVDAVQAGKDVYVEKPIANSIEECNIMMDAAEKTGRVVQVGQWQRSGSQYMEAKKILDSGQLGKIRLVKVWAYMGHKKRLPPKPDGPVPEGVDYDFWLGPAPNRPFNPNRFHYFFRYFWDYAGGLMTDWGVHEIDIALYLMGATVPKSVMASGGKIAFPDDAAQTPDTLQVIYEYDDFTMLWEHAMAIDNGPYGKSEGIAFIGNNGTLVVNRKGLEVIIERDMGKRLMEPMDPVRPEGNALHNHTRNFIEAIKANDPSALATPITSGGYSSINAQMGNIAYRTRSKLHWDDQKQVFTGNKEASEMVLAEYHNGWEKPIV